MSNQPQASLEFFREKTKQQKVGKALYAVPNSLKNKRTRVRRIKGKLNKRKLSLTSQFLADMNFELQSTPDNSKSRLLEAIFLSPLVIFCIILLSITRTPDNSNLFQFPLKVRAIGSQL